MGFIHLEGLEFFAYHGYYDEEQKVGNKYSVDLEIETDLHEASSSDKLPDTINYEQLYRIVKAEMEVPSRLLEHIGGRISDKIYEEYSSIKSCKVAISKYNPPVGGVCQRARVVIER